MIEDDLRAAFARLEALTPPDGPVRVAIEQATARRRRRRFRLRLGGTALALVAAALAGFTAIAPQPRETANLLGDPQPPPAAALNVLLVGVDGNSAQPTRFADSVLLVHVPADRSRLYLVSLPRFLEVTIPGRGKQRLNAAFSSGAVGPQPALERGYRATREAVADTLGVRIDAGAVLTYPLVRKLTDAVGGVPLCLPQRIRSVHTGRVFPAGCQQLDGAASVDLLRQRLGLPDGVLDRDRNAERYAVGLLRRIDDRGGLKNPVMLDALLRQLGSELVADTGDLSLTELVSVAGQAADAEPVGVVLPVLDLERQGDFNFRLDPTSGPGFLAALREDRLGEWTAVHPDQVTRLR